MESNEDKIKVPRFKESEGFYTTAQRSAHMSKIKSKNTKPELSLRKELFRQGVRFRIDYKGLPGKPDISNKSKKFVVFIDGEFWHGHNWEEKKKKIKSNRNFWIPKIERNMQRDKENNFRLKKMGFKVFRFWEHEIKKDIEKCVSEVVEYIQNLN
ncbi:very short patch repair endonuclease [Aquimarina sp. 2304DJ70-9]|uniref:very short patch repair endonuclease n=1 Tax=Aquimarina penaris TaxID=3231044 RepID=UPI003461D056